MARGKAIGLGSIEGASTEDGTRTGVAIFNLGTGTGSSVLDVIHAFEKACGKELPYKICPRRPGDIATNYAACDKAREELGWVAEYDLARMCETPGVGSRTTPTDTKSRFPTVRFRALAASGSSAFMRRRVCSTHPLPWAQKAPVFDGAFFVRSLLHAFEEDFPAENHSGDAFRVHFADSPPPEGYRIGNTSARKLPDSGRPR